jgi:NAD-dependent SIR2 family protein deacetylase
MKRVVLVAGMSAAAGIFGVRRFERRFDVAERKA